MLKWLLFKSRCVFLNHPIYTRVMGTLTYCALTFGISRGSVVVKISAQR